MTEFLIVRHGETNANRDGILAGRYPAKLTEQGVEQGETVAAYLRDEKLDAVYASDIRRAMILAGQIAGYHELPVHPCEGLWEVNLGQWEGITPTEALTGWPEAYNTWLTDQGFMQCPGGETTVQVIDRLGKTLLALAKKHPDEKVLLVSHGYAIRAIYAFCHHTPLEGFRAIPYVPNASISRVKCDGEKAEMTSYGECDFLKDMVTQVFWGG